MTDIETRVPELLDALGKTSDEVAASLTEKGIKGQEGVGCACPIYNYLVSEGVAVREIDGERAVIEPEWIGEMPVLVDLSDPVANFIYFFDQGHWPGLVETAVES